MVSVDVKHHAYLLGIKHQVTYFHSLFSCSHFCHFSFLFSCSDSLTFIHLFNHPVHPCGLFSQFIPVVYSPSSSLWFILPVHPSGLFSQFIPVVYPPSPPLWFILPGQFFQPLTDQFQFIHPCFCLPPIDLKVVVGLCMLTTTITIYFIHPSWKYLVLDHIYYLLYFFFFFLFFFFFFF